jgi:Trk K+ transport system NAD-binding subunit
MTDAGLPGTHAHYVVVGDNPLAYRLTRALSTRFRGTVTVIVPDGASRYAQEMRAVEGVTILEAERVDEEAFAEAGAGRASAAALVHQDDGGNVALALLLREVWPQLHVVVRIFDESLGRHLERDRCTVLSASAFAAPEIVGAALRRLIRLPVKHRRLVAVVDGATSLPTRTVLFATAGDGSVTALPSKDELEHLTPKVYLADAAEDDVLPEVKADLEPDEDEVDPHRRRRFGEYLRTLAITSGWNLLLAAGVLLVVVLIGALTIKLATGASWAGALYEAVLPSLAGSDPDHDANPVVKATQVALTIVSVAVIPWVTGVVVDGVVRTQRLLDAGSPLHPMADHVVVVGLGDLGTRIVRSLDRRGGPATSPSWSVMPAGRRPCGPPTSTRPRRSWSSRAVGRRPSASASPPGRSPGPRTPRASCGRCCESSTRTSRGASGARSPTRWGSAPRSSPRRRSRPR